MQVLSSLESLKNGSLAAGHEDVVLMHLSTACYTLLMVQDSDEELWLDKCQLLLAALQRQAAEPRCFVALAVYQQRQGFACWLDARGLRRLNLLLQQTGLEQTAASAEEAQQASAEEAQQAIQQRLLDVSRQLCAEQPDSPAFTYHQVLALLMTNSRDAALQACRTAMRLAHSQNGALVWYSLLQQCLCCQWRACACRQLVKQHSVVLCYCLATAASPSPHLQRTGCCSRRYCCL